MSPARRIVIVGAGPAGVGAAIAARQQDALADVILIADEHSEPYEKPPLSKAVLTRKAEPHDAPIAGPQGIGGHNITLKPGTRVISIDRDGRAVVTAGGERIAYDVLVLATGSVNRVLPVLPPGPDIHYLRTEAEALALRERLARSRTLLVVGAGLIGLEVAASATELGLKVTVIEVAPRILVRVCDAETSHFVQAHHAAHGVDIRLATAITGVRASPQGVAIETGAGETLWGEMVVVGTGVIPDDRLAKAAGLDTQDGIVVDDHCFTAERTILAAGDCTRFVGPRGPVRLENWRHAQEQGAVAGRNAAGGDATYNVTPSFWSEQYDLYIQGMGWPLSQPTASVRRQIGPNAMLRFDLDGDHLAYALGINAQRDIATARRLIERRVRLDPTELADPEKPLAAMLKVKT
ncbi:MAG TPA: FAD-dependent oxidoreductase [Xanthobacteraceae bacterium]|nr:FAD-dependent oxidoreductase [Xanthobacteraceae bacterium]